MRDSYYHIVTESQEDGSLDHHDIELTYLSKFVKQWRETHNLHITFIRCSEHEWVEKFRPIINKYQLGEQVSIHCKPIPPLWGHTIGFEGGSAKVRIIAQDTGKLPLYKARGFTTMGIELIWAEEQDLTAGWVNLYALDLDSK